MAATPSGPTPTPDDVRADATDAYRIRVTAVDLAGNAATAETTVAGRG